MNKDPSQQHHHNRYMQLALDMAKKAYSLGEVPVGAVLVHQNQVIASAYNMVEVLRDASAHAEMLCLKQASIHLQNWRLLDTTLYCTLEPCAMCAGAMLLARISTLVWSTPDIRHGANGSWIDILNAQHPCHAIDIIKGVERMQSAELLRSFFQKRRREKKEMQ